MIRIVTDTSADLPRQVVADLAITEVPLTVRFGDREYVDRDELSPERFWELLAGADELPQTAAPAPARFAAAYRGLAADGATGVVAVCISSELSGTLQSAEVAARDVAGEVPVQVVDSRLVSGALGLAVTAAARVAGVGRSLDEVAATARDAAGKAHVFGALDTLDHLRRGGRIGAAQAFFGGLLNVKPLITIEDGVVAPGGRVRTRRKALEAVLARAEEVAPEAEEMLVVHGNAADLDGFLERLGGIFATDRTRTAMLGPVVGTHSGPGVIGLCYRLA